MLGNIERRKIVNRVYKILRSNNIKEKNVKSKISEMSDNALMYMLLELNETIEIDGINNEGYVYSTNSDLGGSRNICAYLECRKSRMSELGKFAILFADTVLIEFPLTRYIGCKNLTEEVRRDISEDIELIFWMKTYINAKIFIFTKLKYHFCPTCYEKVISNSHEYHNRELKLLKAELINSFLSKVECTYKKNKYCDEVHVKGMGEIFNHNNLILIIDDRFKSDYSQYRNGQKIVRKDISRLKIVDDIVDDIFDDLIVSNWTHYEFNTRYVTNRKSDIDILSKKRKYIQESNIILGGLEHVVPNICDLSNEYLIDLRKDENDSFHIYRDSVMRAINSREISSVSESRELFNDEIRPKLNKLDLQIKKYKEKMRKKLVLSTVAGIGIFAVGYVTNIIPNDIGKQIVSLGGLEAVLNAGAKIVDNSAPDYQNDELYYLWRIKNKK